VNAAVRCVSGKPQSADSSGSFSSRQAFMPPLSCFTCVYPAEGRESGNQVMRGKCRIDTAAASPRPTSLLEPLESANAAMC
jgi:hypothetical protein